VTDARTQLVAHGYDTMADTWERRSSHIVDALEDEVVTISETDGEATFQWVLARR
jgi:hypothetical protein